MNDSEKDVHEQRIYDRCIIRVGQLEAEKATLCERIDELCVENERLRAENVKVSELVQYILDEGYGDYWFGKKADELGFKANY